MIAAFIAVLIAAVAAAPAEDHKGVHIGSEGDLRDIINSADYVLVGFS